MKWYRWQWVNPKRMTAPKLPQADVTSVAADAKELAVDAAAVAANPQASMDAKMALTEADIEAKVKLAEAQIKADTIVAQAKIVAEAEVAKAKIVAEADGVAYQRKADFYKAFWLQIALAGIAAFSGYFAYRANAGIGVVHEAVNSRMDELLDITKKNSRAEGVIEGREERRDVKGK